MNKSVTFELTKEHLTLIANLNFKVELNSEYDDTYLPTIDRKRPFGNSGAIYSACEYLNFDRTEEGGFSAEDMSQAEDLIMGLPVALEIITSKQTFEPGIYEMDRFSGAIYTYQIARNYKTLLPALTETSKITGHEAELRYLSHMCQTVSEDNPFGVILSFLNGMTPSPFIKHAVQIFEKHRDTTADNK